MRVVVVIGRKERTKGSARTARQVGAAGGYGRREVEVLLDFTAKKTTSKAHADHDGAQGDWIALWTANTTPCDSSANPTLLSVAFWGTRTQRVPNLCLRCERRMRLVSGSLYYAYMLPSSSRLTLRRKEQPSVSLALPPVGWARTCEHEAHMTTLCACEKTVVMAKQPGHLTSMKYCERA